jgi:hypothetical protein
MGQTLNDLNTGNELLREIDTWLINEEEVSDAKIGYARRWNWKKQNGGQKWAMQNLKTM